MKTKAPRSNPIRILTLLYKNNNYGAALQAYALWRHLADAGYDCLHVPYRFRGSFDAEVFAAKKDTAPYYEQVLRRAAAFDSFIAKIPQTLLYTAETIDGYPAGEDDIFVVGSDQIWNPSWCEDAYFLDFVPEHNGKISYAASIGANSVPEAFLTRAAESINRFDAVSVRETQARDLLKRHIAHDISVVPDPTLLLTREQWDSVAVPSPIAEPYIFVYLIGENPEHRKAIRDVAAKTGLKLVTMPHMWGYRAVDEGFGDYPLYGVGPDEFIGLLAGARAVVTDSFHGAAFSIIFEKNFCALKISKDSSPKGVNSRLYSLFASLRLEDRYLDDGQEIAPAMLLGPIDYAKVGERLKGFRAAGNDFLFGSIERAAKRMAESEPYLARSRCSGCTACYAACPVGAIAMRRDDEGFAYPLIDAAKCVDCGICSKVCDSLDTPRTETRCAYAAYALDDDFRAKSSSGGIAALLAERTVRRGGVVYGAAFDENLAVRHVEVNDIEGLDRLRGSKYVQSDVGDTYASAKKHLDAGREVLYTGTACQVAGLKAFLKKDYPNLTTLDVICHGTPSPRVWEAYVAMMVEKHGSPAVSASFRSKAAGWKSYLTSIAFADGTEYRVNGNDDPYTHCFSYDICLRPSCHSCRAKVHNVSDITVGDFWGIENLLPEMDDGRGTSLVIARTPKGEALVDELSGQLRIARIDDSLKAKYDATIAKRNRLLDQSVAPSPHRARFFYELNAGKIGTEALLYKYTYMPLPAKASPKAIDYSGVSYARIDIKNAGADTNDVDVLEISDPEAKVDAPAWLCRLGGRGRVIKSTSGKLALKLKCAGAGKLRLTLRGPDFRKPDKKPRIPVWVSYTKLVVDSKTVFKGVKPVWHDAPFAYPIDVKDGQIVTVSVEWDANSLDVGSGMGAALAARDAAVKTAKTETKKACDRADDLSAKLKDADARLKDSSAKLAASNARLKTSDARLRSSDEKLAKADEELSHLRRRVKALTVDVSDLNAQMEDLEATYSDRLKLVGDARDSLQRRLKHAESVNASLQSQLDDVRSGLSFRIGRLITWLPRKLTGRK